MAETKTFYLPDFGEGLADATIPLFRLEMKYLPSVDKIVAAAKQALSV